MRQELYLPLQQWSRYLFNAWREAGHVFRQVSHLEALLHTGEDPVTQLVCSDSWKLPA